MGEKLVNSKNEGVVDKNVQNNIGLNSIRGL